MFGIVISISWVRELELTKVGSPIPASCLVEAELEFTPKTTLFPLFLIKETMKVINFNKLLDF